MSLRISAGGRWVPVERWVNADMRLAGVVRRIILQPPYTDPFKREYILKEREVDSGRGPSGRLVCYWGVVTSILC